MRACVLGLFACLTACGGYSTHEPDGGAGGDGDGDADADADADACVDLDGDGAGAGGDCLDDCDDLDPALIDDCGSAENCAEGVHTTGCPCEQGAIEACYTGPSGTGGLGECQAGLRQCVADRWGGCEGERRPGDEQCNYADDDCDGVVDDGVQSPCGDCGPCNQVTDTVGVGGDDSFEQDEREGVRVLPDGSVVLDSARIDSPGVIWIANSGEGTISKVDTRTFEELGRYITDPGGAGDPSRSTVNLWGDVVSANRQASTATLILASDCPDDDRDGMVDTSTSFSDVLAWGADECVRWNLPIEGGGARGSAFEERVEQDGAVVEYVWVGAYYSGDVYEIDVAAGELTGRSVNTAPSLPYGAAMGPDGILWVTATGSSMAKVDTRTLEVTQYQAPQGRAFYGITVDAEGYVWTSSYAGAQRFDPESEEFELVDGGCGGGIAADGNGSVWTGHGFLCNPQGVSRIDVETLAAHVIQTNHDTHGVAVDFDGKVWAINVTGGSADVIDPEDESWQTVWESGINYNYTYSDMTGFQLALGGHAAGHIRHVFEVACGMGEDCFDDRATLSWDAEVEPGATITLTGRTAPTIEALAFAEEVRLAEIPAVSPEDLPPVELLRPLGSLQGFLQVDATLRTTGLAPSPVLRSLTVTSDCLCGR